MITRLTAAEPLTKTVGLVDGVMKALNSYPLVKRVTSHTAPVETIDQLFDFIVETANLGGALLTGTPVRPIIHESRAGLVGKDPHTWVCLDFDDPIESITGMMNHLGLSDVSFVWQCSATSTPDRIKGHAFFLLKEPVSDRDLKNWLIELNLEHFALRLTDAKHALHYAIDITAADFGRLIYVAPPVFKDIDDPHPERIVLFRRPLEKLRITAPNHQALHKRVVRRLHKLQDNAGVPRTQYSRGSTPIVLNPGRLQMSDFKLVNDGKTLRFNVGEGTRQSYYVNLADPELVHNFKGEPSFPLKEANPELYEQLTTPAQKPETDSREAVVFKDAVSSKYIYVHPDGSVSELKDRTTAIEVLHALGIKPPRVFPVLGLTWDPTTNERWIPPKNDQGLPQYNAFTPTEYMAKDYPEPRPIPPLTKRILDSLFSEAESQNRFLNWLAYIFKTRKKPGTAWILSGTQGTGKGLLFNYVLTPLLSAVEKVTLGQLDEVFNGFVQRSLLLWLDEFHVGDGYNSTRVLDKLKDWVSEPTIAVRKMRENATTQKTHFGLIIASNHRDPIKLPREDRRFNVAPPQKAPIRLGNIDVPAVLAAELDDFAAFLRHFPVDEALVNVPLDSPHRVALMEASANSVERWFDALKDGDGDFIFSFVTEAPDMTADGKANALKLQAEAIMNRLLKEHPTVIPISDLQTLFRISQGEGERSNASRFLSMSQKFGLTITRPSINGGRPRCVKLDTPLTVR